ncbi:MAG: hypothetical protein O7161_03420 [Wolbachia endosymbiont of Halictus tumulorum]|nr:hypothetical protein [Wolbachia endosymbiont of Halictus tumulorum]
MHNSNFKENYLMSFQRVTLVPGSQCPGTGMTTKGYLDDSRT